MDITDTAAIQRFDPHGQVVMFHRFAHFGYTSELGEQEVMVSVVPRDGAEVSAASIRNHITSRLPKSHVPRFVDVVAEVPRTATGKVEKYRLRERGVSERTDDARLPKGDR